MEKERQVDIEPVGENSEVIVEVTESPTCVKWAEHRQRMESVWVVPVGRGFLGW